MRGGDVNAMVDVPDKVTWTRMSHVCSVMMVSIDVRRI